jgi:hypothetical protein
LNDLAVPNVQIVQAVSRRSSIKPFVLQIGTYALAQDYPRGKIQESGLVRTVQA